MVYKFNSSLEQIMTSAILSVEEKETLKGGGETGQHSARG